MFPYLAASHCRKPQSDGLTSKTLESTRFTVPFIRLTRRRVASRGHAHRRNCCSKAEYRAVVEKALSRVPPPYSVALRLASCEERSMKEIAEYMGISISAVKTRLHRGRAHLRRGCSPVCA